MLELVSSERELTGPEETTARAAFEARPDAAVAFVFVIRDVGDHWVVELGSHGGGEGFPPSVGESFREMMHRTIDEVFEHAEAREGEPS